MPDSARNSPLRRALDVVLDAWRDALGAPLWVAAPYTLACSGADLELELRSPFGPRPVRGRLSASGLLAGRYWAAAAFDAETLRLCPAWLPTLSQGTDGLGEVLRRQDVGVALRAAACQFDLAGEPDEAVLCLSHAEFPGAADVDWPARLRARHARLAIEPGRDPKHRFAGFKDAEPLVRLAAAAGCEPAAGASTGALLEAFRLLRNPLRTLLADAQPALHERALALTEAWARRLVAAGAYREALPGLDTLIESAVALPEMLRLRHETRLALGDHAGARNDVARLQALGGCLAALGSPELLRHVSADEVWQVGVQERVARHHLDWARGRDPLQADAPLLSAAALGRHRDAARARIDAALALLERLPGDRTEHADRIVRLRGLRPAPAGARRRQR